MTKVDPGEMHDDVGHAIDEYKYTTPCGQLARQISSFPSQSSLTGQPQPETTLNNTLLEQHYNTTPSTMATALISAVVEPIRNLISPSSVEAHLPPVPNSWICHNCVYLLPTQSAVTNFDTIKCHGCGHDRCGQCDVVYVEENTEKGVKKVAVVDPGSGEEEHMTFNIAASDVEAVAKVVEEAH